MRRARQAPDEAAVYLQVAEGQVLEVLEGTEARAEVVERNRATECAHARAEVARAGHVGDRGGLGYLDHQPRRLHAVVGQAPLDHLQHGRIAHGQRGEVHGDARRAQRGIGGSAAHGEQREHLIQHHPVDLPDQPVALGRRQEARRWHERAIGPVGQAHERLVVGHTAVGERDDRLVAQHEAVLAQCAVQACKPGPPPSARTRAAGRRDRGGPGGVRGVAGCARWRHRQVHARRRPRHRGAQHVAERCSTGAAAPLPGNLLGLR